MSEQTIVHDRLDRRTYETACNEHAKLFETEHAMGQQVGIGEGLVRDLFFSVNQRVPTLREPDALGPAARLQRGVMESVMGTGEWRDVRAAGTVGDELLSAMATIGMAEGALGALDDALRQRITDLAAAEEEAIRLTQEADVLDELGAQRQSAELIRRAQEARERARIKTEEAEALAAGIDGEAVEDQARRGARAAAGQAEAEINALVGAVRTLGGRGHGGPEVSQISPRDKLALAAKLRQAPKLRKLAELAGKLTRIAASIQKTRLKHEPDEIVGIELGADITRVLADELAYLDDPDLDDVFWRRFVDETLTQWEMHAHEPQGKGPIICAVDESGSMAHEAGGDGTTKELWAKAVTLALLAIARRQRRDFALLHFAQENQLKVRVYPKGQAGQAEIIAASEHFYNGGDTVYEPWMAKALELTESARFDKADVILVSDGLASVGAATAARWNRVRQSRQMRAFAVLIGADYAASDAVLGQLCDAIVPLADLSDDAAALGTIFAI